MLSGRADAPDATLLRALAAAQLDAATRPTISFLHVSAAGGTSLCLTARSNGLSVPAPRRGKKPRKKKARGARSAPAG